MNYISLINLIKKISLQHPFVNSYYYDRYSFDADDDIKYASIIVTPNQHQLGSTLNTFNFNLLYTERMTDDRDNALAIQSKAIDTINEIVNAIENNITGDIERGQVFVYKNQFADLNAGAYIVISITVPNVIGECYYIDTENVNECCSE